MLKVSQYVSALIKPWYPRFKSKWAVHMEFTITFNGLNTINHVSCIPTAKEKSPNYEIHMPNAAKSAVEKRNSKHTQILTKTHWNIDLELTSHYYKQTVPFKVIEQHVTSTMSFTKQILEHCFVKAVFNPPLFFQILFCEIYYGSSSSEL